MYSISMSFLAVFALLVAVSCSEIVQTDCGRVNGSVTQTKGGQVYEFLQIPYAQPPVGKLRWTHSRPLSQSSCVSESVYDATVEAQVVNIIQCVQPWNKYYPDKVTGKEDCLYLSVRTPSLEPNTSLPVLVWIHGGSLKTGFADYPGYSSDADLTDELQMVTVNINYRLEIFGFLSSPDIWEDSENPGNFGNFGIGDAITALQWVQKNIVNFGGNPNSVTILGESSGGTIVLGLLGSDKADGLFHKAISLSAPPIWRASPEYAFEKNWKDLAGKFGCTQRSVSARRRCLKNIQVLDLIKTRNFTVRGEGFYDFPYSKGKAGESMDYNVLDRFIVNRGPFELLHQQRRQEVEVIIGNTAQETGTKAIDYNDNKVSTWREAEDLLGSKIDKFLSHTNRFHPSKWSMLHSIKFTYNFGRDSKDWWPQIFFDTLTTDVRTTCMNNDLVDSLSWNKKIKPYRLYVKSRPNEIKCGTPWSAIHGWDTEALFGYGYYGPYMQQGTLSDPHQVQFEDNMRQLVKSFSYGRISDFWNSKNALVMENDYFPNSIHLTGPHDAPQESKCFMWKNLHMLQYGWQN